MPENTKNQAAEGRQARHLVRRAGDQDDGLGEAATSAKCALPAAGSADPAAPADSPVSIKFLQRKKTKPLVSSECESYEVSTSGATVACKQY